MTTEFNQPNPESEEISQAPITIESALIEFEHWRMNKDQYTSKGIPDELWLKVFKLAETNSNSRIRAIFGINNKQYNYKYEELTRAGLPPLKRAPNKSEQESKINFCEVNVGNNDELRLSTESSATAKAVSYLKSNDNDPATYLDLSTIIVECIRSDGKRLKIHTTTKKIPEVMKAFFECGVTTDD
jgi:hypothetical protein